jgi:hypothetical protein
VRVIVDDLVIDLPCSKFLPSISNGISLATKSHEQDNDPGKDSYEAGRYREGWGMLLTFRFGGRLRLPLLGSPFGHAIVPFGIAFRLPKARRSK